MYGFLEILQTVQCHFWNKYLPFLSTQGASCPEPQTCVICPVQQLSAPPGLVSQPNPPQVPQLAAQHVVPAASPTPAYDAHRVSKYILMWLNSSFSHVIIKGYYNIYI